MVTWDQITEMARRLAEAAHPTQIVLFGSYARGDARPDSDVDLLVVESVVTDRRLEMVRLQRLLSPMRIPVDVVVTSERNYNAWRDTPGTILFEAAHEGKVLHERAA